MTKTRSAYSSAAKPIFVVAIGGSVGGLAAYKELLNALPSDTGMAFVIVSHMLAGATSHLPEILSHYTSMNVIPAFTGMPILANQVYVNSPDSDLLVERGAFKVIRPRTGRNKDVDRFFMSLAEDRGSRAIAVILSGYDGDGAAGCAFVKAKGGMTFAQDASAQEDSMPLSARASGCVDFVMSPRQIALKLEKMSNSRLSIRRSLRPGAARVRRKIGGAPS